MLYLPRISSLYALCMLSNLVCCRWFDALVKEVVPVAKCIGGTGLGPSRSQERMGEGGWGLKDQTFIECRCDVQSTNKPISRVGNSSVHAYA
jgi:hypothetical protein